MDCPKRSTFHQWSRCIQIVWIQQMNQMVRGRLDQPHQTPAADYENFQSIFGAVGVDHLFVVDILLQHPHYLQTTTKYVKFYENRPFIRNSFPRQWESKRKIN